MHAILPPLMRVSCYTLLRAYLLHHSHPPCLRRENRVCCQRAKTEVFLETKKMASLLLAITCFLTCQTLHFFCDIRWQVLTQLCHVDLGRGVVFSLFVKWRNNSTMANLARLFPLFSSRHVAATSFVVARSRLSTAAPAPVTIDQNGRFA